MPKPQKPNSKKLQEIDGNVSYRVRRFASEEENGSKDSLIKKLIEKKMYLIVVILLLIVGVMAAALINNSTLLSSRDTIKVNELVTNEQIEADTIKSKFSELYDVGEEEPVIANITDVELLKTENPEFYEKAINGDIVIILPDSKLAFLYRSEENRILKISPVKISE